jgi:hypothetical protein
LEGKYSTTPNASQCLPPGSCDPGFRQTAPGTATKPSVCAACKAGDYCAGGTSAPQPCGNGTYDKDNNPSTLCVPWSTCEAGSFAAGAGSAVTDRTCTTCADGSFSTQNNVATCTNWMECEPGERVSKVGNKTTDQTCAACANGSFSSTKNAEMCKTWTNCEAGTFVSVKPTVTNDRTCTKCPDGQVSTGQNAPSCSAVNVCAPGTQQMVAGDKSSPCVECIKGTYCAGGDGRQVTCASGSYDADMDSATQCVDWNDCKAGTVIVPPPASNVVGRACSACATGTFSTGVNATAECKAWTVCKAGFEVSTTPTAAVDRGCAACKTNEYSTMDNSAQCTAQPVCAAGTEQTAAGTSTTPTKCETCKAGEYCVGGTTPSVACGPSTNNFDDDKDPKSPCKPMTDCKGGIASTGSSTTDRVCAVIVLPDASVPNPIPGPGLPTI